MRVTFAFNTCVKVQTNHVKSKEMGDQSGMLFSGSGTLKHAKKTPKKSGKLV